MLLAPADPPQQESGRSISSCHRPPASNASVHPGRRAGSSAPWPITTINVRWFTGGQVTCPVELVGKVGNRTGSGSSTPSGGSAHSVAQEAVARFPARLAWAPSSRLHRRTWPSPRGNTTRVEPGGTTRGGWRGIGQIRIDHMASMPGCRSSTRRIRNSQWSGRPCKMIRPSPRTGPPPPHRSPAPTGRWVQLPPARRK